MPRRSSSPSIHEKKITPMPKMPTVPTVNSQRPSFLQTMKEGISFGVGSSIGHRIVGAAFGEPTPRVSAVSGEPTLRVGMMTSQTEKPTATGSEKPQEEYEQCMKKYDDIAACKRILEKNKV